VWPLAPALAPAPEPADADADDPPSWLGDTSPPCDAPALAPPADAACAAVADDDDSLNAPDAVMSVASLATAAVSSATGLAVVKIAW
jgi:hypothetical protein